MITVEQCRAARALLGITQQDLASAAGVNNRTLMDFESGNRTPVNATLKVIEGALTELGVDFLENGDVAAGRGVAMRSE